VLLTLTAEIKFDNNSRMLANPGQQSRESTREMPPKGHTDGRYNDSFFVANGWDERMGRKSGFGKNYTTHLLVKAPSSCFELLDAGKRSGVKVGGQGHRAGNSTMVEPHCVANAGDNVVLCLAGGAGSFSSGVNDKSQVEFSHCCRSCKGANLTLVLQVESRWSPTKVLS